MLYYAVITANTINDYSTFITVSNIHIIGVTQTNDLVGVALQTVQQADAIIGSERQLDIVKPHLIARPNDTTTLEKMLKPLPKFSELKPLIDDIFAQSSDDKNTSIVILASGDPLYYGIGRWFSKHFSAERLHFYPAISSIQMACHRLAISLQDVTVLSLHGRPLATLRTKLKNSTKLMILTDKHSSPHALARECRDTGFELSTITVLENLSYPHERVRTFSVEQLLNESEQLEFAPLHISLIDLKRGSRVDNLDGFDIELPEFPGIPDTAYITGEEPGKGMITKREVRLCILSLLQPSNDDIIWDIGAGCGGVAVELAYWNDKATIYAIECHEERLAHLSANQQRFGVVKNLHIINGKAPDCLTKLPLPNKVFIGGSGGHLAEMLETVWTLLPKDGLLVVSAVVNSTKQALYEFAQMLSKQDTEIEVIEVAIKRGHVTNTGLDYTPKLPVEVFKFKKA